MVERHNEEVSRILCKQFFKTPNFVRAGGPGLRNKSQASKKTTGVYGRQRPVLPFLDHGQPLVRDMGNEGGRHVHGLEVR